MTDLNVKLGGLELPTPIGLASGTCGYGAELDGMIDWSAVGAIFTKGISLEPRRGNPPPRIWETASGMLNAIGLENVGLEVFVAEKMPWLREWRGRHGGKVIVNLYATSAEDYGELTRRLDQVDGIDGFEVNLSCPNVKEGGITFGTSPDGCALATAAVRGATDKWVAVKLSPASPVAAVARASRDAGADALSTGNTMPAMAIDIDRRVARLSMGGGGLSGPALRPVNVKMTFDAAQAVDLPIIGVGGIVCADDTVEYLLAGASAVQVGTATFSDPNAAGMVRDGLIRYLEKYGESSVYNLVGGLIPPA